ncbi:hypothetical protein F01_230195 [Burkholderia cenocepacia]|nr:hypothetical protein F01_230195 [Burkholderia cenocepacia]
MFDDTYNGIVIADAQAVALASELGLLPAQFRNPVRVGRGLCLFLCNVARFQGDNVANRFECAFVVG